VNVFDSTLSGSQAQCLFRGGDAALPDPNAVYQASSCAPLVLDVSFIGDSLDRSGSGASVSLQGGATVDLDGVHFGGSGEYVTVAGTAYAADDDTFTISYWMTKEDCTGGIYEYMYSHNHDNSAEITDTSNSNINMYLGCEGSGGGWSSATTGTVLRYNLVDGVGTWAMFDFPLHDAGDFDAITNLWVHVVLVVSADRLLTYDDGQAVSDSLYGFYTGGGVTVASNVAYPHPGTLTGAFGAFDMTQDIVLGSRGDLNEQRHFMGEMAGLMISDTDLTSAQVQCIFTMSEEFLPTQLVACETSQTDPQSTVLSVSFLGSSADESGHGNSVSWTGEADVTFSGALFDGDMDYVTVSDFTYETGNGEFTVAFWMTKEDCTDGVYEYMYSHMSSTDSSTMWSRSGLNIYLGCEQAGGGQSSLGGAVIRYSLVDTSEQEALFDTPLHDAGDFDAVTRVWVHVVLAVTPTSVRTYDDGYLFPHQPDDEYGFYTGNGVNEANLAQPDPGSLSGGGLGAMDFALDLVLGGRADHDRDRHFLGKMALVNVFDSTLSGSQAQCLFRGGDAALPWWCVADGDCLNGGTCTVASFGVQWCSCRDGWVGRNCADVDEELHG